MHSVCAIIRPGIRCIRFAQSLDQESDAFGLPSAETRNAISWCRVLHLHMPKYIEIVVNKLTAARTKLFILITMHSLFNFEKPTKTPEHLDVLPYNNLLVIRVHRSFLDWASTNSVNSISSALFLIDPSAHHSSPPEQVIAPF